MRVAIDTEARELRIERAQVRVEVQRRAGGEDDPGRAVTLFARQRDEPRARAIDFGGAARAGMPTNDPSLAYVQAW